MLTDMRRCILANVGSAVLALSTFLTVFKEEEQKERLLLHCVLIFFFLLAVKIVDLHAACCHCTTLHFANTTTLRCTALQNTATHLSRWRRRVVVYRYYCRPHSTRLVSFRSLRMRPPCTAPVRALNKFRLRCQQRTEQRVESSRVESESQRGVWAMLFVRCLSAEAVAAVVVLLLLLLLPLLVPCEWCIIFIFIIIHLLWFFSSGSNK